MVTVFWEVLVAMHATGLELLLQIPLHLMISDIIDTIAKPSLCDIHHFYHCQRKSPSPSSTFNMFDTTIIPYYHISYLSYHCLFKGWYHHNHHDYHLQRWMRLGSLYPSKFTKVSLFKAGNDIFTWWFKWQWMTIIFWVRVTDVLVRLHGWSSVGAFWICSFVL